MIVTCPHKVRVVLEEPVSCRRLRETILEALLACPDCYFRATSVLEPPEVGK